MLRRPSSEGGKEEIKAGCGGRRVPRQMVAQPMAQPAATQMGAAGWWAPHGGGAPFGTVRRSGYLILEPLREPYRLVRLCARSAPRSYIFILILISKTGATQLFMDFLKAREKK